MDVFNVADLIKSIYLVVAQEIYNSVEEDLRSYQNNKPIFLCKGGNTRAQSVYNAIRMIDDSYDKVCICLLYTSDAADPIQSIYLVVAQEIYNIVEEDLRSYQNSKPILLCKGGNTRAQSVYNAIQMMDSSYNKVCIHDAVRPLIQKPDIENVL